MNSSRTVLTLFVLLLTVSQTEIVLGQVAIPPGITNAEEILEKDRIYRIYKDRYEPDSLAVNYLSAIQDSVEIYIFFGSWCRESKKYIPGLIKTLNSVQSPFIKQKYISVDEEKKFPQRFLIKFDIKYIPTVVVLVNAKEVGRIGEKPRHLIETDLVEILKNR